MFMGLQSIWDDALSIMVDLYGVQNIKRLTKLHPGVRQLHEDLTEYVKFNTRLICKVPLLKGIESRSSTTVTATFVTVTYRASSKLCANMPASISVATFLGTSYFVSQTLSDDKSIFNLMIYFLLSNYFWNLMQILHVHTKCPQILKKKFCKSNY